MYKLQKLLLIILPLFFVKITVGQNLKIYDTMLDSSVVVFRDTISNFVFDSTCHDVGIIKSNQKSVLLTKYFKYIGTDTIIIEKAWTTDPHFIYGYPPEPLIPNKIYTFKALLPYRHCPRLDSNCKNDRYMGFICYNYDGNKIRITLKFKVEYESIKNTEDK